MSVVDQPAAPIPVDTKPIPMASELTKREHYAAIAMQGLCKWDSEKGELLCDEKEIAKYSVLIADKLIKELAK